MDDAQTFIGHVFDRRDSTQESVVITAFSSRVANRLLAEFAEQKFNSFACQNLTLTLKTNVVFLNSSEK